MKLSLIAAVAANGAIGRDNALLWHLSGDMKHFRETTTGSPIIMGRKTWDSIGRPLPKRTNIVVTRQAGWNAEGALVTSSLAEAVKAATSSAGVASTAYVIGGAQIYAEAIGLADELVLTEIESAFEGDTFFPDWSRDEFTEASRSERFEENGLAYRFVTYERTHR